MDQEALKALTASIASFHGSLDTGTVERLSSHVHQSLAERGYIVTKGWRPIDDRAKTGVDIFIVRGGYAVVARWGRTHPHSFPDGYWDTGMGSYPPSWPTHYMPLPLPPMTEEAAATVSTTRRQK